MSGEGISGPLRLSAKSFSAAYMHIQSVHIVKELLKNASLDLLKMLLDCCSNTFEYYMSVGKILGCNNLLLAGVGCGLEAGSSGHFTSQLVDIDQAAIANHSNQAVWGQQEQYLLEGRF